MTRDGLLKTRNQKKLEYLMKLELFKRCWRIILKVCIHTNCCNLKHEYLRSRAYICLSLSSPSPSHLLKIYAFLSNYGLSRYSCLHLGSLHPRILWDNFPSNWRQIVCNEFWLWNFRPRNKSLADFPSIWRNFQLWLWNFLPRHKHFANVFLIFTH